MPLLRHRTRGHSHNHCTIGHVVYDTGPRTDDRFRTDHQTLPDHRTGADMRAAAHSYFPTEAGSGRDVDMVTDDAVVCDVHVIHRENMTTDTGHHSPAFSTAMNRAKFPNQIVVADLDHRRLALELQILRFCSDRGELEDMIARSNGGVALDHRIRANNGVRANAHSGADHRTRSDFDRSV